MNRLLHKWPKGILVGLGAVILSTLAIQASDSLSGVSGQLASSITGNNSVCGEGAEPWRFVTYTEASQLCARDGKRLPTAEEWYKVALGHTDVTACFTATLAKTGANNCVTPTGIHDLVGNVWEWTADTVTGGMYNNNELPNSGYVALVDGSGLVIETTETPNPQFGEDYAWIDKSGVRGLLRGGFYGSGDDGGVFAQNIAVPLNFTATGVGFRCVKDVW